MSAALQIGPRLGPAARAIPVRTPFQDEVMLAFAYLGVVVLMIAMSFAHLGSVARPLYMVIGIVFAMVAKRRSPWLYVNATMWFWLFTPFVRRIIDWHAGFSTLAVILVTPNLMAMLMTPDIFTTRGLFKRPGIGYAMILAGCVVYGLFLSFLQGNIFGGALSATDWLVPLLYLFYFICKAEHIDEWEAHLGPFLTMSLVLLVPYGLYQYFLIPPWDALWMIGSGMGSVGNPIPMGSKVFGPLNAPGILAIWCGTSMVLLSYFKNKILLAVAPPLLLLILLGQVRAVYGAVTLALVVGAFTGRGGFGRLAIIVVLAGLSGYVGASIVNPKSIDQITKRFETLGHLSSDGSAIERAHLYSLIPDAIENNIFGTGIAGQGRGRAAEGGREITTLNIDSGPLSDLLALGMFAGSLHIIAMLLLQIRVFALSRRWRSPFASIMAAGALSVYATYPFLNILGFVGVILWICIGSVIAMDVRRSLPASRPAGRADRLAGAPA